MNGPSGVVHWVIRLSLDDTKPDGWAPADWERTVQRASAYYVSSLKSDNPILASYETAKQYLHHQEKLHQLAADLVDWYEHTHSAILDSAYSSVRVEEFLVRLVGIWGEDIGEIDLLKREVAWHGSDGYPQY